MNIEKDKCAEVKVCVITSIPPVNILVNKFAKILEPSVKELVLLTGNFPESDIFSPKMRLINLNSGRDSFCARVQLLKYISLQVRCVRHLLRNLRKTKVVFFFLEGGTSPLPLLIAKVAFRRTIIVVTHSSSFIAKQLYGSKLLVFLYSALERISFRLADRLIVYSPGIVKEYGLNGYKRKIVIAHEHFIDFSLFNCRSKPSERRNIIGFVGRLRKEKGILGFLEAAATLVEKHDWDYFVIGDGELRAEVEAYIADNKLADRIRFIPDVRNEDLPMFYDQFKLLVIPSFTEGLVNVMLEAMACGTPVLASAVGAIPDIIKDGETGFLLRGNSAIDIAEGIVRVFRNHKLDAVSARGIKLMFENFTLESAISRYHDIMRTVLQK